jgi:hypothetical protein
VTASLDSLRNKYSVQGLRHILVCVRMGAACPSNCNPAEFFIQLLAIVPNREEACRHTIDLVCDSFQASEAGQRILAEAGLQGQVIAEGLLKQQHLNIYATTFVKCDALCTRR